MNIGFFKKMLLRSLEVKGIGFLDKILMSFYGPGGLSVEKNNQGMLMDNISVFFGEALLGNVDFGPNKGCLKNLVTDFNGNHLDRLFGTLVDCQVQTLEGLGVLFKNYRQIKPIFGFDNPQNVYLKNLQKLQFTKLALATPKYSKNQIRNLECDNFGSEVFIQRVIS